MAFSHNLALVCTADMRPQSALVGIVLIPTSDTRNKYENKSPTYSPTLPGSLATGFQPGSRPPNMSPRGPTVGIMGNMRDVSQSPVLLV